MPLTSFSAELELTFSTTISNNLASSLGSTLM